MTSSTFRQMLDTLCPMHVIFERSGEISFAGPTAVKICPERLIGQRFLDVFEIKRPREINSLEQLHESAGKKLNLRFRTAANRQFKGVLMEGPDANQMIVNLSFGFSVVDAVMEFDLTAADFAATDLTVEMLYLVEAKSAAMEASRQLNQRLQSARVEAEAQALTDTLTGLVNRRGMDQALAKLLAGTEPFAVVHLDLDFFKAVNDTMGHAAGDFVLQKVAEIMLEETRKSDVVARVGGDEFVILFDKSPDRETLAKMAQRIIQRLQVPMLFEGNECRISASAGLVLSSDYQSPDADHMLGDADVALYASKNAGRGRHMFFDPKMRPDTEDNPIAVRS